VLSKQRWRNGASKAARWDSPPSISINWLMLSSTMSAQRLAARSDNSIRQSQQIKGSKTTKDMPIPSKASLENSWPISRFERTGRTDASAKDPSMPKLRGRRGEQEHHPTMLSRRSFKPARVSDNPTSRKVRWVSQSSGSQMDGLS
jgi:hypothetical protein